MGGIRVNNDQAESGVISLLCFLAVSARGLVDEPKAYGPLRLMEAAQRLIDLAEGCGIRHELLKEVAKRIEEYPLDAWSEGEEEFIRFMDDLVALLATWVKQS
jgi:hypothetical protein